VALIPAAARSDTFHYPRPAAASFVRTDVPYTTSNGAPVGMDVYRPAKSGPNALLPAFVFLNSTASRSLRTSELYRGWAEATTARGMVALVPDATMDFAVGFDALLAYVRDHARQLKIDPERIAVYAASGNAFGSLPVIEDPKRTGIAAAVVYYGAGYVTAFRPDLPILFVRAGLDRPGMNEDLDSLVAAGLRANAPVSVINYPSGRHGFETLDDNDATRDVIERTFRFVERALDPKQRAALKAGLPVARAAGAMRSGDYTTAAALYGELVAKQPDDAMLRLSYGEALLGAGRAHEARAEFDRLKDKGLGYRDLGLPAARAALADGDPADAVAWLKTIPKRFLPRDLASDPDFAGLRGRADFQALLE
jgi:dienelactone hydrolase